LYLHWEKRKVGVICYFNARYGRHLLSQKSKCIKMHIVSNVIGTAAMVYIIYIPTEVPR